MSAISQRSRPLHWDEVVGQEHVKNVLRPALERGRIGHAYLFSGPRGVGKTTTARLIAMTVNCDSSGMKPCGHCESCKSVIAGRHPDVLEVDAASNNSVDDVRDLREKVALQPMRGSKKVYILDEAHMMSKSAFNALLKTLEEPPSHVVFVLATTEPERLPPTILSRCQHYRFRRLSAEEIAGKLGKTAQAEGVSAMPQALNLMAKAADGAMRDGESLLERLLAAGEPTLTLEMVEAALGLPPQERIEALAHALAAGETAKVMQSLGVFYADGFAPRTITERVKIALRDQLHNQLGLGKRSEHAYGEAHLLHLIKVLDEEDSRFARASDLIALEMVFTKALVSPSEGTGVSPALESRVANLEKKVREAFQKVVAEGLRASGQQPIAPIPDFDPMARTTRRPAAVPESEEAAAPVVRPSAQTPPPSGKGWADVILKADLRLRAILKEAKAHLSADTLVIEYSSVKSKWHADQVANKLELVSALVQQVIGQGISVELIMPDGTKKNSRNTTNLAPASRVAEPAAKLVPAVSKNIPKSEAIPEPETNQAPLESQIAFQAPSNPHPKAGLFSPAELIAALEPEHLPIPEPEVISEILAPANTLKPATPKVQDHSPEPYFDDLPPEAFGESIFESLAPAATAPLETFDLESSAQQAPPAALEIDFGDLDTPTQKISSLAGHPNYQLLSKLFVHRVLEVGQLAPKAENNSEDAPNAVEESE
ncbi:MAG: DNA polymerase III subunit gamma/tau [Deinococcales bacterium]